MSTNDQEAAADEMKAAAVRILDTRPLTDLQLRSLALGHAVHLAAQHGYHDTLDMAERFRAFLAGETTNV